MTLLLLPFRLVGWVVATAVGTALKTVVFVGTLVGLILLGIWILQATE